MIRINLFNGLLTEYEYTQALLCATAKWVAGDVYLPSAQRNGRNTNRSRTLGDDMTQRLPASPGAYPYYVGPVTQRLIHERLRYDD